MPELVGEVEAPDTGAIAGLADAPSGGDEGLTQDAILDKYTEDRPQEETPAETAPPAPATQEPGKTAEAKSVEETPEQAAAAAAEAEAAQGPLLPGVTPENISKAFKSLQKWHPDAAKAIREAYYENRGYHETGFTLPEVRELRTMFDNVQSAKEARGSMADLMAADELMRTNPSALLEYIGQKSPEGFMGLALSVPGLLYKADPNAYRERIAGPAVKTYHDYFEAKAREVGNDDVVTAIQFIREFEKHIMGDRAYKGGQAARPAADPAMTARLSQLEGERAEAISRQVQGFRESVDSDFNTALRADFTKMIEGSGADLSEAAKQDVIEDAMDEVKSQLLNDLVLQKRLEWSVERGQRDEGHRQQLNAMLLANAKRFGASAISKYLGRMTKEILRANAGRTERAAAVVPTRNVGGGAPFGTTPRQPLSKEDIDKMSEDDIITAAAQGRLG